MVNMANTAQGEQLIADALRFSQRTMQHARDMAQIVRLNCGRPEDTVKKLQATATNFHEDLTVFAFIAGLEVGLSIEDQS